MVFDNDTAQSLWEKDVGHAFAAWFIEDFF